MSIIRVEHIEKSYKTGAPIRNVSFELNQGDVISVIGPSGTGKSTFLRCLNHLETPTSGQIIVDGIDVHALKEEELAHFRNHHIGFIFQFHQLLPEFTALENTMMPGLIAGEKREDVRSRAETLLTNLNLADRMNHKPSQLSGGEKQRVAAARAMMMNPAIILADEPSGSLDEANKQDLHNLLLRLRQQFGQTILIVTHDKDLAAMSDRTLEMRDGLFI